MFYSSLPRYQALYKSYMSDWGRLPAPAAPRQASLFTVWASVLTPRLGGSSSATEAAWARCTASLRSSKRQKGDESHRRGTVRLSLLTEFDSQNERWVWLFHCSYVCHSSIKSNHPSKRGFSHSLVASELRQQVRDLCWLVNCTSAASPALLSSKWPLSSLGDLIDRC